MLSEETGQTKEAFLFNNFKYIFGKLYYKGKSEPLSTKWGKLRSFGEIKKILTKERLREFGFDIPKDKVMAQQVLILNRVEEEMPSTFDIARADNIELQEITENAVRSTENLIEQLNDESSEDLPMHKLVGLNKQLRSIRGSQKVEDAKRLSYSNT